MLKSSDKICNAARTLLRRLKLGVGCGAGRDWNDYITRHKGKTLDEIQNEWKHFIDKTYQKKYLPTKHPEQEHL